MASNQETKHTVYDAGQQQKMEESAHVAGIAEAFAQLSETGPQVLSLQQSLLAGIARSQRLEAMRLAERHGDGDERMAAAEARADRMTAMHAEWGERIDGLGKVVETFVSDGLFHGYVMRADGTPAVGYGVRLELAAAEQRRLKPGSAKTDGSGYFRIELEVSGAHAAKAVDAGRRWSELFAGMMDAPVEMAAMSANAAAVSGTGTANASAAAASSVTILDPAGRKVFEDFDPPAFASSTSDFRYYVLDKAGTVLGGEMK